MVGYVSADKPNLRMWEYELYCSYYCGICKSIKRRYGNFPRLVLSYDSVFLAMLLGALNEEKEEICRQHCIVHPVRKKNICINNEAVDYAADIMIILAYFKAIDDINDDNSPLARVMELMFRPAYRKLKAVYPGMCEIISEELSKLSEYEHRKSSSLDATSDSFARIMEAAIEYSSIPEEHGKSKTVMKVMAFYLGKWMYLIDAFDDIEENIKDGNYNPLIYRYDYNNEKENAAVFRERIREHTGSLLFMYLGEIGKALDLLELRKNQGIIDNIVYMGLNRKTEEILKKGIAENERSI